MASNTEFAWQVASTSISRLPSASVLYHAPRGNSSRRGDGVCRCLRVAGVLLVQLHRRNRAFGAAARRCLLLLPRPRKALPVLSQRWACAGRSEEHTSEFQSLMRISYAVFCLKKKKKQSQHTS